MPHLPRLMRQRLLVGLLLGLCGCASVPSAPRRPNVQYAPNGNLVTIGFSADRSASVFRARNEAQRYCWDFEVQKKPFILSEATAYQGRYDEQINEAGRVASQVGGILGQSEVAQAGRVLSSPTDYETRIEFQCR